VSSVYVVAEIGCNHNGDEGLAKKMIKEAASCGVDAVKLQSFKASNLISKFAPKASYQIKTTGNEESQLAMTQKLELSYQSQKRLMDYANELGLDCFATPFDSESAQFLSAIGQKKWKIPSGEITNRPFLKEIAGYAKLNNGEIVLSTGMATIEEIGNACNILIDEGMNPDKTCILHCNTEYPTPDRDVNLLAMKDIKKHFPDYTIGLSDHSVGSVAAIGAVALGAVFIEKHFTLDKNMNGPDHKASSTPEELKELISDVRRCELMMGIEKKIVTPSERNNMKAARKSIVAACDIFKGDIFTSDNVTCKRPGNGISPMEFDSILGLKAEHSFMKDQLIEIEGIPWQE
jgi:N-acetylneuraminate synthase